MAHVTTVQYTARDNHLLEAVALAHQTNWGEWLGEVANRAIVESCGCHGLFVGPAAKTYVLITLSTEPPLCLPSLKPIVAMPTAPPIPTPVFALHHQMALHGASWDRQDSVVTAGLHFEHFDIDWLHFQ
jgi:hypothetical protein